MPAVECPTCQKPLRVPDERAGQTAKCPHCSQVFMVPAPQPPGSGADVQPATESGDHAPETTTSPRDAASIVVCAGCQSQLRLPAGFQSGKIRCPHCGTVQSLRAESSGSDVRDASGESAPGRSTEPPTMPMVVGRQTPGSATQTPLNQRWRGSPDGAGGPGESDDAQPGSTDDSADGERIIKRPPPLTAPVEMPVEAEAVGDHPWYLTTVEGQTYGPIARSELVTWVSQGRVSPNCMVCREGDTAWRWARDEFPAIQKQAPLPVPRTCPNCGGSIVAASGQCDRCGTAVPSMPTYGGVRAGQATLEGVTVPLLVSAISNIAFAVIWGFTCWGIVFALPLVVLCIFEFSLYSSAAQLDRPRLAQRAQVLAIFELIVGLLNVVSLVCGIVILINCSKLTQQHA